jgi:hypothetical protein
MRKSHGSASFCTVAESIPQCNISNVSWEENGTGTKAMTTRIRPIHSGFETLRLAGLSPRSTQGYHNYGSATHEQLTARAFSRRGNLTRPTAIFADFRER